MENHEPMSEIGVVIIGRNEGERLLRCLESIGPVADGRMAAIVYVDSGSTDGSVAAALRAGARIVELDMTQPFTAARARNAGRAVLPPQCGYIQFVDGDCMLQPGWLAQAAAALDADAGLAAVFGRRREIAPGATVYNWLCDVEWAVPPGPVRYFGGDVMIRAAALDEAGGYPDEMIAGEEPDLAMRLRKRDWRLACLPGEMTLHDAAIDKFGQFWRRAKRSGHAYAELAARHGGPGFDDYRRRLAGVLFWGFVPVAGVLLLVAGLAVPLGVLAGAGAFLLVLPLVQLVRLTARGRRSRKLSEAFTIALFQLAAKPAQALGIGRYWLGRLAGKRSALIEYKRTAA
jgi:glycosyltransferase involved in cell wall biosynthesis